MRHFKAVCHRVSHFLNLSKSIQNTAGKKAENNQCRHLAFIWEEDLSSKVDYETKRSYGKKYLCHTLGPVTQPLSEPIPVLLK